MNSKLILIGFVLSMALGVTATLLITPKCNEAPPIAKGEIEYRDSIISHLKNNRVKLLEKVDSLAAIRAKIEYRYDTLEATHQNRHRLPFDVADTGARYRFFSERFPDLFTSQSNR